MSLNGGSTQDSPGHPLRWWLRLAFACAVLVLLFSQIPLEEVLGVLRGMHPLDTAVAFTLTVGVHMVTAWRLRILTDVQGLGLSTLAVFEINLAARFYGLFLPGGNFTSVAIRVFKLSRVLRDWAGAGLAMLADRTLATTTLCAMGTLAFWLDRAPHPVLWVLPMLAAGAALALLCALLFSVRIGLALRKFPLPAAVRSALGRSRLGPSRLVGVVAASVLSHILGTSSYLWLARSLDIELGFVAMTWLRSAIVLATLIPVSVAGLGLREGAAVLFLAAYGVGDEHALAFALLVFAVTVFAVDVLGGLLEGARFLGGSRLRRRAPGPEP